jgi:hypothetical protein
MIRLQVELENVHNGLTREGATTACIITIGADATTACGLNLVSPLWHSPMDSLQMQGFLCTVDLLYLGWAPQDGHRHWYIRFPVLFRSQLPASSVQQASAAAMHVME